MFRYFLCLARLLTLTASSTGIPSASEVRTLVDRLESRYREARSLQVSFLERYSEDGHVVRVEAGTAFFRRPNKMRWEYDSPENNLFLVDGKTAWFYVPADHTVTRVPAKQSTDWRTPLALLAGGMKTSRVCGRIGLALDEKPESPDNAVLYCQLRDASGKPQREQAAEVEGVLIEVVRGTGDLARILIRDRGGVAIEFHFANWKSNPPLSNSLFRFVVSPSVAIVNAELPPGNRGVNP